MWLWLPDWLPIAGHGVSLFVDCRPGPLHCCLMVDYESMGRQGPGVA